MKDYPAVAMDSKDDGDIYVRLSLSKYPFLKDKKHGDTGTASFKGEIESSENNEDGKAEHKVVFQDLSSKSENVRV